MIIIYESQNYTTPQIYSRLYLQFDIYIYIRFFYKEHFFKQRQAENGKNQANAKQYL